MRIFDYIRGLFTKYLHNCWCFYSLQTGIISYCVFSIVVALTSIIANIYLMEDIARNQISFTIMLLFQLVMIGGYSTLKLGAFLYDRKLLMLGFHIITGGVIFWILICLGTFIIELNLLRFLCIDGYCPESQWLIDMRWRYAVRDCPFRKGQPAKFRVFRDKFFVDEPRDALWEETTTKDIIFEDIHFKLNNNSFISFSDGNNVNNVTNINATKNHSRNTSSSGDADELHLNEFKAWYPGCENREPYLIFLSVCLFFAYICFYLHLLWMLYSLFNEEF